MDKIYQNVIKECFEGAVENYSNATLNLGLWASEKYVFSKYFKYDDRILDVGCGTGRTTFALYELGYKKITGLDLTPTMLDGAREINKEKGYGIEFVIGDATNLEYEDNSFDCALFSFNGIMQIPMIENRIKAMSEIRRVIKKDGYFIFTTHDRNSEGSYKEYWENEKKLWEQGQQDARLYEFGDRIALARNEIREVFIHIPDRTEILECINKAGLTLVEDFYRSEKFNESEAVKKFSGECRFWITKKG